MAVIAGFERSPATRISRFCSTGIRSSGSSMPRSPRATIRQSETRTISIEGKDVDFNFAKADTNDAAEGVLYQGVSGPNVAVTPKSVPFAENFKKRYGNYPSYAGYTAYDEVYYIADAVKRAGSIEADKLVAALEKTDWEGTIGRVQFYGKDDPFTHSIKYGKGLITGLMLQWQGGKQTAVWPKEVAKSDLKFPGFVKVTN